MSQELMGLEYLKKKEIKNMKCDMNKPFAFISYSHDEYDSQIVMNVFKKLMERGHNLWIDIANMPADEHTWKKAAIDALTNKNCKFAFFFRSESSMIKKTIENELETIKILDHIKSIVVVDIWHEDNIDAGSYYKKVMNSGMSENINVCYSICGYVSPECKAIRLARDAGNDISKLIEEMEEELKNIENTVTNSNGVNIAENAINNNEKKETSKKYIDEEFNESDDINEDENLNRKEETIEIVSDGSVMHIKGKNGIYDAFYRKDNDKYTILRGSRIRYSESYTPKKVWEQNKKNITADGYLLCDIGDLVISAAAKLIEGMSTNGKELDAPERIMGENETYSVTFDLSKTMEETDGKMINPKEKSEFCGEDSSVFKLMGYEQKKDNAKTQSVVEQNTGFEYTLWGDFHTSGKMVDMLNDIFDLIAEKYPEKIKDIAENDKITAVARKTDLDEKTANISKIKQFSNYKGKEHSVEGEVYCVNAGYNRDGCIKQIERMLIVCGGNSNDFKITKAPHKSTHSASKSGKKDIGEILNA